MLGATLVITDLRFWKVESIGNDFVLVRLSDVAPDELPALALALCPRRFSIGSDGLLAVGLEGGSLMMRMFNPDGTEDFCGNGLRASGLWAHRQGWLGTEFDILHRDARVPCRVAGVEVEVVLPAASFAPTRVPHTLGEELFASAVKWNGGPAIDSSALTTGSTHTVLFCEAPATDREVHQLGPVIEHHAWFPQRTSVVWAWPEGPGALGIRIWERGVGETRGCGTGSSAACVAWLRAHGGPKEFAIRNPGGVARVRMAAWDAPIHLRSDARLIYEGAFSRSLISRSYASGSSRIMRT